MSDEPVGVLLVPAPLPMEPPLRAARRAGGARWQAMAVCEPPPDAAPDTSAELQRQLRRAWEDAEFERCLELAARPELDLFRALRTNDQGRGAAVVTLTAACHFKLGQLEQAQRRLAQLLRLGLLRQDTLQTVRAPDFLAFVDLTVSSLAGRPTIDVRVETDPPDALVQLDGGLERCTGQPCVFALRPGEHLLSISRPGHAAQHLRRSFDRDRVLSVELRRADADEARMQFIDRVCRARQFDTESAALAGPAFGAEVAVLLWRRGDAGHALLFDRAAERAGAQVSVQATEGGRELELATNRAITQWRGLVEPGLARRPWFWAVIGTVALAGVVAAVLLAPSRQETFTIRFGPAE